MVFFRVIVVTLSIAEGLRSRGGAVANSFTDSGDFGNAAFMFETFVRDFGRTYTLGSEEYERRASIFHASLLQISVQNSRSNRSWTAGVHPFMDWTDVERARLHSYQPSRSPMPTQLVSLQTNSASTVHVQLGGDDDGFEADAPEVRDQGGLCGSCWAISVVEAVEAQLMKTADTPWLRHQLGNSQLSPQALLDCVAPETHCGTQGGCTGAPPEFAFNFLRDHGIPLEKDLRYHPADSPIFVASKCPIEPVKAYPSNWARARISGWRSLPSNQVQPLMQAIVNDGPAVIAADSHNWYDYSSGIFDGCPKDADINHMMLAKGYGVADGKKYWRIQNSWGSRWGEDGSMRLLRHDDEDQWCGEDKHIEEGFACAGETRKVTVCGNCGLLFNPIVPQGASLSTPGASSAPTQEVMQGVDEDAIAQGLSEVSAMPQPNVAADPIGSFEQPTSTSSPEISTTAVTREVVAANPQRAASVLFSSQSPESVAAPNLLARRFLLEHATDNWSSDESSVSIPSPEASRSSVDSPTHAASDSPFAAAAQLNADAVVDEAGGNLEVVGQDPALSLYAAHSDGPDVVSSLATHTAAQQFPEEPEQVGASNPSSVEAANSTLVGDMSEVFQRNGDTAR